MEITNAKNTICNFKRLLGRRYNDLLVQEEKDLNSYSIVEGKGGSVNIEVIHVIESKNSFKIIKSKISFRLIILMNVNILYLNKSLVLCFLN